MDQTTSRRELSIARPREGAPTLSCFEFGGHGNLHASKCNHVLPPLFIALISSTMTFDKT